jgi:hypothetical protein
MVKKRGLVNVMYSNITAFYCVDHQQNVSRPTYGGHNAQIFFVLKQMVLCAG